MLNNTFFRDMTTVSRLQFILDHAETINPNPRRGTVFRSSYLSDALWEAHDILPEGKSKRALNYVARNPLVEFHFGGNDAVGPAIMEAIVLLKKSKVA
jgi:hypothetical protein